MLIARFFRAFEVLICFVTTLEVFILINWEILKAIPIIGSLPQVTFLEAYLIPGEIYTSFRKAHRSAPSILNMGLIFLIWQ